MNPAMLRLFPEHQIRPAQSLDGAWDFVTALERRERARLPKTYPRTVQTPAAWETLPGLETYRGRAWFRTSFTLEQPTHARLVFGGVSHTATVFVDGRARGGHYDAFTPFEIVAPRLSAGRHELVVAVDNSFGPHSALHIENDYYSYGGLTRPIVLEQLPDVSILRVWARPLLTRGRWSLDLRVWVRHLGRAPVARTLSATLHGQTYQLGAIRLNPGRTRCVSFRLDRLDVTPWEAQRPTLYPLQLQLLHGETAEDDLIDRIGFRVIEVKGPRLLLNGRPLRLRGYNRHEDHPHFGCALPLTAMARDLDLIRDLGCNFVRTSHYPNDRRFLDLCDERGVYVWEESHARCTPFKAPKFREQIAASTREMIEWHHNHPSIVIWGCLNECDSKTPRGRAVYKRVLGQIRALDPSRPRTFASCMGAGDRCCDLVDIVSFNLYPGWYWGNLKDIATNLDGLLRWLRSPRSGGAGKPMIVSEFGGAALHGYRHPARVKWSEEYQADLLEACLKLYLHHPAVVGAAIWQFCDVRVCPSFFYSRPRCMNNKGTVDEYRRPKLAYAVVRRLMREAARRWDG